MADRFVELLDPSDNYLIWDEVAGQPAMLKGRMLVFARRHNAAAFVAMLNRLEAARTEDHLVEATAGRAAPEPEPRPPDSARVRRIGCSWPSGISQHRPFRCAFGSVGDLRLRGWGEPCAQDFDPSAISPSGGKQPTGSRCSRCRCRRHRVAGVW